MCQIIKTMTTDHHQQLLINYDPAAKLKAFIAIHSTVLGPALAGCRMYNYKEEAEAISDALNISKSMSYRASLSGCDLGGASIVLWGDPQRHKSESYFRALGRIIQSLEGNVLVTSELGTDSKDMVNISKETEFVAALPEIYGGSGDTSHLTALGVFHSIKTCVKTKFKSNTLANLVIAVQGAGRLGANLIEILKKEEPQAKIIATDINYDRMKAIQDKFGDVKIINPATFLTQKCDILAPCARGSVVTKENVKKLKCKIIAGCATNILADEKLADVLYKKSILFAPDFLINAGEVIQIDHEIKGLSEEVSLDATKNIAGTLAQILKIAGEKKISSVQIASNLAKDRISKVAQISYNL